MKPAAIVLDIERARVALTALEGHPPPRLLRPAVTPCTVAHHVKETPRTVRPCLLRALAARLRARLRHVRRCRDVVRNARRRTEQIA